MLAFAEKRAKRGWWLLVAFTALGLLLRAIVARELPLYIDEGNSLLGALGVARHGVPLLPSGAIYLHGATFSYLLAPLAMIGGATLDQINAIRILPVLIGTAAIPVTAAMAQRVAVSPWVGIAAAALMAVDPLSVHWSAYVRMYPLLQLTTALSVLCVVVLMQAPPASTASRLAGLSLAVLFWIGVFTHLSAALLWPVIAVLGFLRWRLALPQAQPALTRALAWGALAPVAQIGVSSIVGNTGTRDATEGSFLPSVSFLGDHRVDPSRVLSLDFGRWIATFPGEVFGNLPAVALIAASIIIAAAARGEREVRWTRLSLLALYWLPTLALVLLTTADSPRYFAFLQPLAIAILAVGGGDFLRILAEQRSALPQPAGTMAIALLAALLLIRDAQALSAVGTWGPLAIGDQRAALARIAAERQPGELVINQTPVLTYLALGNIDETRFLNRHDMPNEYVRYTRFLPDGRTVDYWLGQPTIGTMSELCQALADHPGSFVLMAEISFAREFQVGWYGEMIAAIEAATIPELDADGVILLRSLPSAEWEKPATATCAAEGVDVRVDRKERREERKADRDESR